MTENNQQTIIIADDHPLFRSALCSVLEHMFENPKIVEAGSLEEASEAIEKVDANVDLCLIDLMMPGMRGFTGLMLLRANFPEIPLIVVSAQEDHEIVVRCLELGASAFIPKSTPTVDMQTAIQSVLGGGTWKPTNIMQNDQVSSESLALSKALATLTPQQIRVLMMLSEGLLNKQIAYKLGVSEATIKAHVSAILQKLNVDSRTQAVIVANRIESGQWQSLYQG